MIRKIVLLGLVLLVLGLPLGCDTGDPGEDAEADGDRIAVEVATVERGDLARHVELSGEVDSDGNVAVIPQVGGKVQAVRVSVGDWVEKDQLLLELENDDVRNQLRQAESAVDQARLQLESASEVQLPRQLDRLESELRQAEESLQQAESQLESTEELGFEKLEEQLGRQLNEAEIAFRDAERNYERMQTLYRQDIVSAAEFERAESEYETARSRYESAREQKQLEERSLQREIEVLESQVRQASNHYETAKKQLESERAGQVKERSMLQAQLRDAEIGLEAAQLAYDKTRLEAPFSGTVASVSAKIGEEISPGAPLLSLVDYESLYVEAKITERQLEMVEEGAAVEIELPALGETYRGTAEKISLAPVEGTRSYQMKVYFDEPAERVRLGQIANLKVVVEETGNVIVVPRRAVLEEDGVYRVFVVENDRARERVLELGLQTEEYAEVLEGLEEGDQMVVQGQHYLEDGSQVDVVEGGEDS